MKFIDEAKIQVVGGHGGRGCVSFRREKYVPRGGPDGGNGGAGGNVILKTDPGLNTLMNLKGKRIFRAERGGHGKGKGMHGRGGGDEIIRVPVGALVRNSATRKVIADLTRPLQELVVARGGKGGRGNMSYVSSTRRAPRLSQPGEPGEDRWIELELKLLADVGLVGRPNAGKSTLISRISAARPKIADYPFTTLRPYLGVVAMSPYQTFTVADIPGLIEGAHQGSGMGIKFLRHIERTRLFLHLVDLSDPQLGDPYESFLQIEKELLAYSKEFADRTRWVVFTKKDLIQDPKLLEKVQAAFSKRKINNFVISAVTGEGLKELLAALAKKLYP